MVVSERDSECGTVGVSGEVVSIKCYSGIQLLHPERSMVFCSLVLSEMNAARRLIGYQYMRDHHCEVRNVGSSIVSIKPSK